MEFKWPKWFSEALLLTVLTGFIYYCGYVYESHYLSHFFCIGNQFSSFEIGQIVKAVAGISRMLVFAFVLVYPFFLLVRKFRLGQTLSRLAYPIFCTLVLGPVLN
jgi:hypothetical protein